MANEALDAAYDRDWVLRIEAWERLKNFGTFPEIPELSGVPIDDLDFAARYGDQLWCRGDDNTKCQNLDWGGVQAAMDTLSGKAARQAKLKIARRKAHERMWKRRFRGKIATLLREVQTVDFIVFPTEILNTNAGPSEDLGDDADMMHDGLEIISLGDTSPAVEYWEKPARKQRTKLATATRVAKCRQRRQASVTHN